MNKSISEKLLEVLSPHIDNNMCISLHDAERLVTEQQFPLSEETGCNTLKEAIEATSGDFILETVEGTPCIRCLVGSRAANGNENGTPSSTEKGNGESMSPQKPSTSSLESLGKKELKKLVMSIRTAIYKIALEICPNRQGLVALTMLAKYLKSVLVNNFETDDDLAFFLATNPEKFEVVMKDGKAYARNAFQMPPVDNAAMKPTQTQTKTGTPPADTMAPSERILDVVCSHLDADKRIPLAEAERLFAQQGIMVHEEFGFPTLKETIEELNRKFSLEQVNGALCIRCLMPINTATAKKNGITSAKAGEQGMSNQTTATSGIDIHNKEKFLNIIFRIKTTVLNISIKTGTDTDGFVPLPLLSHCLKYCGALRFDDDKELIGFITEYPHEFEVIERDGTSYVRNNIVTPQNESSDNTETKAQATANEMDTTMKKDSEENAAPEETTKAGQTAAEVITVEGRKTDMETEEAAEAETASNQETGDGQAMEMEPEVATTTLCKKTEGSATKEKDEEAPTMTDMNGEEARYISLHKIEDFAIFSDYEAMLRNLAEMAEEDGWLVLAHPNEPQPLYVVDLLLRYHFTKAVESHRKGDNSGLSIGLEKACFDTGFHTADGKQIYAHFVINRWRDADNCMSYRFQCLTTENKA